MSEIDTSPERVAETWPQGGYAPGGYMCKCSTCGKTLRDIEKEIGNG